MVADRGAGLALGDRIKLGRTTFSVVGLTENQVASGGDPVAFITLLDAQKLQFDLAPPATRVQTARGTSARARTPSTQWWRGSPRKPMQTPLQRRRDVGNISPP